MKTTMQYPLLLLPLLILACKEPVPPPPPPPDITPCYSVQNDTFMDPRLPVQFLNCSQGATAYRWDFGDGATSDSFAPAHIYADTGIYDVRLDAILGEFQESLTKRVHVTYPCFQKITLLQMPVLNPDDGMPWDPEGDGLDIRIQIIRSGQHQGFNTWESPFVMNIALPYVCYVTSNVNIKWDDSIFMLEARNSNPDTVCRISRPFEWLIDNPTELISNCDSIVFEVTMRNR